MTWIIVIYEEPMDEYNEERYALLETSSTEPKEILKALAKYGLSYELKDPDCKAYIIGKTITGLELMRLANITDWHELLLFKKCHKCGNVSKVHETELHECPSGGTPMKCDACYHTWCTPF